MRERPTVPCKACGDPTTYTSAKLCNNCWEVVSRLKYTPVYAEKVFKYLAKEHRVRVLNTDLSIHAELDVPAVSEMDARVLAYVLCQGCDSSDQCLSPLRSEGLLERAMNQTKVVK